MIRFTHHAKYTHYLLSTNVYSTGGLEVHSRDVREGGGNTFFSLSNTMIWLKSFANFIQFANMINVILVVKF